MYITPGCFDKGGISRYNRYQIRAIRELIGDKNVRVISLMGHDKNDIEEPFEVYWHGHGNSVFAKIKFAFVILKTFFTWRPSVIHTTHVNFSGLTVVLAKLFKARTILNIYGIEIWSGLTLFKKMGLKRSDFILSDCHNTADYVKKNRMITGEIMVIWDCVDLDKFKHREQYFPQLIEKYKLPDRKASFIVLTLGRMSADASYKGYSRLIEVLDKVLKKKKNVKLIMAGSGDYLDVLKESVRALGIEKNVIFTGSVDENDIVNLYSYAHLFSLVTEIGIGKGEGIPLTPLEAMACGTPIIVGNQDGSKEAVFENENGYVIDPNDLDRHTEIICDLADHSDLREKMALGAEKIAKQCFGYELFKEKHVLLFNRILFS